MKKNLQKNLLISIFIFCTLAISAQDFTFQKLKGLNGGHILCVEKADTSVLYAGTTTGIYRSADGGLNWEKEIGGISVYKIKAHTKEIVYAGTSQGLFRRDNFFRSWRKIDGFTDKAINDLDILSSGIMFVSVKNTGLYKGDIDKNQFTTVSNLGYSSSEYLIGCYGDSTVFIDKMMSSNAGDTWTKLDNGFPTFRVLTIVAANMKDSLVLAGTDNGVFRYNFSKKIWEDLILYQHCLDMDIDDYGNIFLSSAGGVYRSKDRGENWQQINLGLSGAAVWTIRIAGNKVFAGSSYGLDVCNIDGTSWTASDNGITEVPVYSILALTDKLLISSGNGVLYTKDDGHQWRTTLRMDYHTNFNDRVRKFVKAPNGTLYAGTATGLYFSNDGGDSWLIYGGSVGQQIYDVTFDNANNLLKATYDGVYKSTDEGMIWTKLNENDYLGVTTCLAVDADNHLFVGTHSGIFETDDNGAHWENISGDSLNTTYFQKLIYRGNNLYAATSKGVYAYDLLYHNWAKKDVGMKSQYIQDLLFDSNNGLFAATYSGIYSSSDSGLVWRPLDTDSASVHVTSLEFDTDENLYFGTGDDGIYSSKKSFTNILNSKLNKETHLLNCYPNPFGKEINVKYTIPQSLGTHTSLVKVLLMNEHGERIATLQKINLKRGTYSYKFSLQHYHLPTGIYIIKIEMGTISETRKIIHL